MPFLARYRPVPRVSHGAAHSMISGTTPCSRSARPSARPAIPPTTSGCVATAFAFQLLLSPRFLEFRGSRQNPTPRANVGRYGECLGGLRLSEKPSTQTQLAIDG